MSERGSWVTQYVYCDDCATALVEVLAKHYDPKYLTVTRLSNSIVAGKIGGLWAGEELNTFDIELRGEIEKAICHPLRIVVVPEGLAAEDLLYEPA